MAGDPAFAALVEAWRERLRPDGPTAGRRRAPHGDLWQRIVRALPANDNAAAVRGLRFWRGATAGAMTLAAASIAVAVMLANRPPVIIQPPRRRANCSTPAWSARPARRCRCSSPPTTRPARR